MANLNNAVSRGFLFNEVKTSDIPHSAFDLSHELKTTTNFQTLTPVLCEEVLPGDVHRINTEFILKAQPLLAPVMHRCDVYIHSFFVPNRLIIPEWESIISPGNGKVTFKNAVSYTPPAVGYLGDFDYSLQSFVNSDTKVFNWFKEYFNIPDSGNKIINLRFFNYFDIPLRLCKMNVQISAQTGQMTFNSSLPRNIDVYFFDALLKVYNDYYRDQNFEEELPLFSSFQEIDGKCLSVSNISFFQSFADFKLIRIFFDGIPKAWEKDYFTSCLPSPQRGAAVTLALTGSIEIPSLSMPNHRHNVNPQPFVRGRYGLDPVYGPEEKNIISSNGSTPSSFEPQSTFLRWDDSSGTRHYEEMIQKTNGTMDLNGDSAINVTTNPVTLNNIPLGSLTVETLRRMNVTQKLFEKYARGGMRYAETLTSIFGVYPEDARLQRPEFLDAKKTPITISETIQTSGTSFDGQATPQGTKTGNMFSTTNSGNFFTYRAQEHGVILVLLSIMPRSNYFQGVHRKFFRRNYLDWALPDFANLGEQPVYNYEIRYEGNDTDNETFGYLPKYTEYKFLSDRTRGDFEDTLKYWTLSRDVQPGVTLDSSFIRASVSRDIFAVEMRDFDQFLLQVYFDYQADRPLPLYGTPELT
ncbi:major capsid protein [Capybara microvirus Cap1_SP_127]|nr:major capsid protein [Capybara microvirus Cap1_SP_127]